VGLVEDEQRLRGELVVAAAGVGLVAQPVVQRGRVGLVAQQGVRDDEAGVGGPGVDAVAALAPAGGDVVAVEDDKGEAEALLHLLLPLAHDGGRTGDDDAAHALAQEHLAEDEAGFDGLAEADVVGDKEAHARHGEGLAQGLELVVLDLDAGAVRSLEEVGVGCGDAAPAQGVEIGGEQLGAVEAAGGDAIPRGAAEHAGVELVLPEDLEGITLGVVLEAGEAQERGVAGLRRRDDLVDEVLAAADVDDLAGLERGAVAPWSRRLAI
jgi:hypothetical protein